jgi:hypothetical protein
MLGPVSTIIKEGQPGAPRADLALALAFVHDGLSPEEGKKTRGKTDRRTAKIDDDACVPGLALVFAAAGDVGRASREGKAVRREERSVGRRGSAIRRDLQRLARKRRVD